jgi:hypothetical protein
MLSCDDIHKCQKTEIENKQIILAKEIVLVFSNYSGLFSLAITLIVMVALFGDNP